MKPADLERRRFLQNAAVTGASFWLLPVASFTSGCKVTDTPVPGKFLSKEQAQAAQVLADQIIPSDSVEPGAAQLGVTDYIEQLLTAFDHDPPRIYAAQNSNGDFIPLNRYQEAAWRLQLYGGTAPSGAKVTGLRELIPQGLDKALSLVPVGGLQNLPELAISALLQLLDRDFWAAFSSLVLESSFARAGLRRQSTAGRLEDQPLRGRHRRLQRLRPDDGHVSRARRLSDLEARPGPDHRSPQHGDAPLPGRDLGVHGRANLPNQARRRSFAADSWTEQLICATSPF